ncbi:MAG TPA: methyltransferase, TIGR04325 family [Thermoanaerobaculia bacterium]|nr:methyltransferase, TIGR04325 family [Thermoanaerobaculia bacterium]
MMRRLLHDWLPPAISRFLRRLRRGKQEPEWQVAPDGWTTPTRGWNVESVAAVQARRWPAYIDAIAGTRPLTIPHETDTGHMVDITGHNAAMMLGYVLLLVSGNAKELSVLDWGGGLGHYAALAKALAPGIAFDYSIWDVPLLTAAGRATQQDVRFIESRDDALARRYDLVIASSSLWYESDWRSVAADLARCGDYVYLTRMAFVSNTQSFTAIQRPVRGASYMTEYICWIFNRDEFVSHLAGCGLELVREFLMEDGPVIGGAGEQPVYRGFLFRRRETSRA